MATFLATIKNKNYHSIFESKKGLGELQKDSQINNSFALTSCHINNQTPAYKLVPKLITMKLTCGLSVESCNRVKSEVIYGFRDWRGFQIYIAPVLDDIIEDAKAYNLDAFLLKRGAKKFLKISAIELKKEERSALYHARIILDAIYVMMTFHKKEVAALKWNSIRELLVAYPQFHHIEER